MKTGIHHDHIRLDNHSIQTFRECPRKFDLRINNGLIPADFAGRGHVPDPALLFGLAIHEALDVLFAQQDLQLAIDTFLDAFSPVPEDAKRTPGRGVSVLEGYYNTYFEEDAAWELVQTEQKFEEQIGTVAGLPVIYTGLIDKILTIGDRTILMDHKTSSWDSPTLATSFQLHNQFLGYAYIAKQKGIQADSMIADILLIKPKNNDFVRYEIDIDQPKLDEWQQGIMQTIEMMLSCHSANFWPQYGKDACTSWNRLCPFFELCDTKVANRAAVARVAYQTHFWDTENR